MEYQTQTCVICGKSYEYNHKSTKGHTKTKCNSCLVNIRRFKFKQKCLAYKGGKCEDCGYDKCSRALTFHHLDPKEKDFSISGNHARRWDSVVAELDKCILLCANCHAEEHEKVENLHSHRF